MFLPRYSRINVNFKITFLSLRFQALEMEERQQKRAEYLLSVDERKRPYNSMYEVKAPTEDELEAYKMKKRREEDPMSQFL